MPDFPESWAPRNPSLLLGLVMSWPAEGGVATFFFTKKKGGGGTKRVETTALTSHF